MARESEFLRFAVDEIDADGLKDGEEEELSERQPVLARHEELLGDLENVLEASSESRNGALSQLRMSRDSLKKAARIDSSLGSLLERFDTAFLELEDIIEEVRHKCDEADYDPAELERIDERLSRIAFLEKKYAAVDIAGILAYAESARSRLEGYENRDAERKRLTEQRSLLQKQLVSEASQISEIRKSAAGKLELGIEKHLHALGMREARFSAELDRRRNESGKVTMGSYGIDDVEFLLSANHGESLKPLRAVASGGELSRVMLAIKTVLAESDSVQTMIFDEVDAGIGGEVARSVGEHLHSLSTRKQVFCITHLASIAVFADNHLKVDKRSDNGRTVTSVQNVRDENRVREVARMLAGDSKDTVSLSHAARLLAEQAGVKIGKEANP